MLRLCGIALLFAAASLLLREAGSRLSFFIGIGAGLILLFAIFGRYGEILTSLSALLPADPTLSACLSLCLRATGVGILTGVCADLCRQLGEPSLAGKVEWLGKAEILLLSLPTVKDLFSLALSLAGAGG